MRQGNLYFKTTGIALSLIWIGIVVYACLFSFSGYLTIRNFNFNPIEIIRFQTLYTWVPWIVLAPLSVWLAQKQNIKPKSWIHDSLVHMGFMLLLIATHGYIDSVMYYQIGDMTEEMKTYSYWQHTGHILFQDNLFLLDAFIYSCIITSQNIKFFYNLATENELANLKIQSKLVESRLQTLKMQINPHFLFNTLNSISVLIKKGNNQNADKMIILLSDFFRAILDQGESKTVPLEKEITLISKYLQIEQARFGDRLKIKFDIPGSILNTEIPILLLQPLVENAILHGLSQKTGRCQLTINARQRNNHLTISIIDDGLGADTKIMSDGIGLKNVKERLSSIYANNFDFNIESKVGRGTSVSISLPAT